ncbi:hypothetical protein BLA3211_04452 [Burkholderia aenigmatica]|uniref:Uncharacterized protein n=2 Tax=Burkholderiaceae TaxID=119060 RepID=A0A6J5J6Y0_9BURK|nr:hypothetical protein BLA3211_04452 [Burkholderia aenigmatica]
MLLTRLNYIQTTPTISKTWRERLHQLKRICMEPEPEDVIDKRLRTGQKNGSGRNMLAGRTTETI